MSEKTVEVRCACGRHRRVRRGTAAARGLGFALLCKTCRLLKSVQQHRDAIERLLLQVVERRM